MKYKHSLTIITTFSFLFALTLGTSSCGDADGMVEGTNLEILVEVNKIRKEGCQCGSDFMPSVPLLQWNDNLEIAAAKHAHDMAKKDYFSHTSLDGSTPSDRAAAAGYSGNAIGENIALGYNNITDVMRGWIESEGHCKNMMSSTFTEIGVARDGEYWVMNLGR